jgi:hypothetical protein
LIQRFGEHRVLEIPVGEGEMPLLALDLESRSPVTVICTNGLSEYKMPVPETMEERTYNELCFCLPSYWEWENLENPSMNWIFPWIQKLTKHVIEKETWFGHGHTIPNGKELPPFSPTMKQNHLFLSDPIALEKELQPVKHSGKMVHFLTIIPIFSDEMDFKQAKGTFKFLQRLSNKGVDEILDDYRTTVMRGKWRIF